MLSSTLCQLPLGLLFTCVLGVDAGSRHLHIRDPNYDVLGGANFPDPSILEYQGVSYVFGTVDGAGHDVPISSNADFSNASGWSNITDAFPNTDVPAMGSGGWAAAHTTWAPDVNHLTDYDGSFAMYYAAALQSNSDIHCIGLARSLTVAGPYNDSSTGPMICPEADGGAIDPAGFLDDDNTRYLIYKIDGPSVNGGGYCNSPEKTSYNTSLMLQQLGNDGYSGIGGPVVLYNNQGESDSYNTEAPSLAKGGDGTYFLFFSSGCTSANSYTLSYLTSISGVAGPYGERRVLLETGSFGAFGPGGADLAPAGGKMVYHSLQVSGDISYPRVMDTARVTLCGRNASVS